MSEQQTTETDLYYLQDRRQYVGNSMMWWREGGDYTCDLNKAAVFSKADAYNRYNIRDTDVPWPKAYIDARASRHVDMQLVKRAEAMRDL